MRKKILFISIITTIFLGLSNSALAKAYDHKENNPYLLAENSEYSNVYTKRMAIQKELSDQKTKWRNLDHESNYSSEKLDLDSSLNTINNNKIITKKNKNYKRPNSN